MLQASPRFLDPHILAGQVVELGGAEVVVLDRIDQALRSGGNSVAPTGRKVPGEDLEYARPLRGAVPQCSREHGQFVVVGQQGRGHCWAA